MVVAAIPVTVRRGFRHHGVCSRCMGCAGFGLRQVDDMSQFKAGEGANVGLFAVLACFVGV